MDLTARPMNAILVLDDDRDYHDLCETELAPRHIVAASTAAEAARCLLTRTTPFDLVFVDLFLDEPAAADSRRAQRFEWGIDVVAEMRRAHPRLLLVLVSGGMSLPFALDAKAKGANATVPKQFFSPGKIVRLVEDGRLRELEESCTPRRPMSLARNEREYLTGVYIDNDRNATKTSTDLGISRSTLYDKLRTWRE